MEGKGAMSRVLDAKGLACPLPVLRARKAMKEVPAGEILEVLATDPGAVADFASFCEVTGHALVASDEADGVFSFKIRKRG
jgi:tRNA 2-thiouridine synthesizing protein A